ncbi:MAG: cytochrome c [Verrucomicrobia bacterium]|nr:cytochrome c [Verrucomicrobiota bacterium]
MNAEPQASAPLAEAAPKVGFAAVPIWLIILTALLGYRGCMYVDQFGGGFDPKVYTPYASFKQLDDLQTKDANAEMIQRGKRRYNETCGQCHQAGGLGTPWQFPPLAGSEWVTAPDPARLIRISLHAVQGPITVNGQQWDLIMSLNAITLGISDDDLAAILTYIRQDWGNKAPAVTPAQIAAVKKETGDRATPWTAEELKAVPLK